MQRANNDGWGSADDVESEHDWDVGRRRRHFDGGTVSSSGVKAPIDVFTGLCPRVTLTLPAVHVVVISFKLFLHYS